MAYSIRIVDMAYFYCLIEVQGPREAFPLVVGYSLRNEHGQVQDVRHRRIDRPGYALWHARLQSDSKRNDREVIFALYPDRAHSQRLADTGWVQEYRPPHESGGMKARVSTVSWWETKQNERYAPQDLQELPA